MEKINELIKELPDNDYIVALKLLNKRNFSELAMLVWSDVCKIEKYQRRKKCPEKYKEINLKNLIYLKTLIDNYNIDSLYEEY